jgi:hypothetical protein
VAWQIDRETGIAPKGGIKTMAPRISRFLGKLFSDSGGQESRGELVHERLRLIVSGLPRSGTSMMMKMLEAGGIPPLTDELRTPDADNPRGYYEFERVKQLDKGDTAWLQEAQGTAVKVIAALLKHLPSDYDYKVIFMQRDINEMLASQKKMLDRRGKPTDEVADAEMARLFQKHLAETKSWLATRPNFDVIYVSYNEIMADPILHVDRIVTFLGQSLDVEKMVDVIDPRLYRQRR